ncbi:MAG: cyclic nucleotide-binding domain-containing protein [Deltaproteobacteria bacterium]|nr:cyclic nucleotide-binding domain-containing protein [Deltaproteobacteria bacterium]
MISIDELRKIHLVQALEDAELEKLRPLCNVTIFSEKATIFEQGQDADHFYMLFKGKVLLEVELAENIMISLGSVKPGYCFGWSSLFRGSKYTSSAICSEPSEVISLPADKLISLMEKDPVVGYKLMKGALEILRNRLTKRTDQFLKTLRMHPDIQSLFAA